MGPVQIIAMSAVLVAGLSQTGVASAHPHNVQVVRGGQPASIAETQEARVQVFRGSPAAMPVALESKSTGAEPITVAVSSGSRIWFVDRAAGTLSVCRLVSTTQVGEHRIDCQSRALPL